MHANCTYIAILVRVCFLLSSHAILGEGKVIDWLCSSALSGLALVVFSEIGRHGCNAQLSHPIVEVLYHGKPKFSIAEVSEVFSCPLVEDGSMHLGDPSEGCFAPLHYTITK